MRWPSIAAAAIVAVLAATVPLHARTLCTIVVDAHDGVTLVREGACEDRVTPASTFKLALAVMGFDGGFLKDATTPTLPFREGYPDWLGDIWRRDTNPTTWLEYSVVWYSQQIAKALGRARLEAYARDFSYGNGDFSGDAGKDNGLERAWISSSLNRCSLPSPRKMLENSARNTRSLKSRLKGQRNAIAGEARARG